MDAHRITFLPINVTIEYDPKMMPYHGHGKRGSILDIALNHAIALTHTCGGNCACTSCHVIIRQGEQNLSEIDEEEEDKLYLAEGLTLHSRLGCQAVVMGDVTVEIPE